LLLLSLLLLLLLLAPLLQLPSDDGVNGECKLGRLRRLGFGRLDVVDRLAELLLLLLLLLWSRSAELQASKRGPATVKPRGVRGDSLWLAGLELVLE
jgi:Zn-dependent protease with chaperone function